MHPLIPLLFLAGLAACGAAGAPERPGPDPATGLAPGIGVSGSASIGVSGGL